MRLADGTFRRVRKRVNLAGHAQELTFSCFRGMPLLNVDRSRRWLIEAIDAARNGHGFELWAYVIMPNHVHLPLMPSKTGAVSPILKSIKQSTARRATEYLRRHVAAAAQTAGGTGWKIARRIPFLATRWWLRSQRDRTRHRLRKY
jgi:REP element-mobilizing transposase RayT